jgi:hypothetical protein
VKSPFAAAPIGVSVSMPRRYWCSTEKCFHIMSGRSSHCTTSHRTVDWKPALPFHVAPFAKVRE